MKRFLLLFASITVLVTLGWSQEGIQGKPTNLDEHGDMQMGGPLFPHGSSDGKTLAGEDGSTMKYEHPQLHGRIILSKAVPATNVDVTTRSYDNYRSGANLQEKILKPSNVANMVPLFHYSFLGDTRGVEAQGLSATGVRMSDGKVRDLTLWATMTNDVYAYDHDSAHLFWEKNFGAAITGSTQIDGWLINQHWGILSTPVYDASTQILYFVTWTSPDDSWRDAVHTIHAIRVSDGKELHTLNLSGVSYDPGHGLPKQSFEAGERKNRAALSLVKYGTHSTVLVSFGTIAETSGAARGWVIAYDADTNTVGAAWTATAKYSGGGLWSAGGGPVVDDDGEIYAVTGNGSFDAVTDFSESVVHLHYVPPTGSTPGSLKVVDWWSPYSDSARAGGPANGDHITIDHGGGWDDVDLASGGLTMVKTKTGKKFLVVAGKDGAACVLDPNNLGKTQLADFLHPQTNWAKAKFVGYVTYPGQMDLVRYGPPPTATPDDFTQLNFIYPLTNIDSTTGKRATRGWTRHDHSTPPWFKDALGDVKIDFWGENGNLRVYHMDPDTGKLTFLANGAEVASPNSPAPPGGMPGGMMSISANGTQDAILWASVPEGDANKTVTKGVTYAYDANNLGKYSDGTGSVRLLWRSPSYVYNKFDPPFVSGGKLYVETYDGGVDVYGLEKLPQQ